MKIIFRFLALLLLIPISAFAQTDSKIFENLKFRFIGPEGNRAIAIAGVPGNPMINYIGAASGGLWKTTDGGLNWKSIFDEQDVSSIGSIAIAPTNPDVVWAGTGETFVIRPAHAMGDGIYKSEDAGKTWKNMGLDKTTDGGKTWKQIFFLDENTGAAELALDPKNPDRLLVGMWSIHINTWGLRSGGAGGGVYRSLDGGETWEALSKKGLPGGANNPVGKTAVAISHSEPNIVYALFEIDSPALYRSEDFGETWTLQTRNHDIAERAPYYTRMAVSSSDSNEVYFASVKFSISKDGGKTIDAGYKAGGDNHDIWVDPTNSEQVSV